MADIGDGDSYYSEISEWWDHEGTYHPGAPDDDQLLDDAVQVTIHTWDDAGNDVYFTSFSDDGWTPEEIEDDIEDGYNHYVG